MNFISTYSHFGRVGVLIDVKAQNDSFLSNPALTEGFIELCQDIAMHIAATDPTDADELLNQPFFKNPDQSILELLGEKSELLNESITISRFIRWVAETSITDNDPRHDPALSMQVKRA